VIGARSETVLSWKPEKQIYRELDEKQRLHFKWMLPRNLLAACGVYRLFVRVALLAAAHCTARERMTPECFDLFDVSAHIGNFDVVSLLPSNK
jgi:hypothetical protein